MLPGLGLCACTCVRCEGCEGGAAGLCPSGLACGRLCSVCKCVAVVFCRPWWNVGAVRRTWTPGMLQCTHMTYCNTSSLTSLLTTCTVYCFCSKATLLTLQTLPPGCFSPRLPQNCPCQKNAVQQGSWWASVQMLLIFNYDSFFHRAFWELIWHQRAFITSHSLLLVCPCCRKAEPFGFLLFFCGFIISPSGL